MSGKREIKPEFSFRFTIDEIKEFYGSAEGAFEAGDYLIAAQLAEPDSELKGCSLVLAGLTQQGLAVLTDERIAGERAVLCRALALWLLDRNTEARTTLEAGRGSGSSSRVEEFRRLLDRDDINVFITGAMLPIFRDHHSASMLAPSFKYGPITTKYVASQMPENAYDYRLSDPFDEFIAGLPEEEKPDFLFALSPQWLLPRNFHKIKQPKLLWCHDTDVFAYRSVDDFSIFDIGICGCSQEHFELSRVARLHSVANIMSNPLNMPFPETRQPVKKDIDVIFSGSSLDPFHSEKPRFIYQLAELNDPHVIRIVDGHVPEKQYFDLLASSRFLAMVGRQAGAPSPRWRDALANGSCVLFPEGTFYDEVSPGCFPYRACSIASDVRRNLKQIDRAAREHPDFMECISAEVSARFAVHRQTREKLFEIQLKYAAFLALVWQDIVPAERPQRRHVWLTPCIDSAIFGRSNVREKVAGVAANIADDELCDCVGYNAAAQLHEKLVVSFEYEDERVNEWASRADDYFSIGLERHPNSLLLRFNQAHWQFFKPGGERALGVELFRSILENFDDLVFDVADADVGLPYTLLDRDPIFPYYEYADAATYELVTLNTPNFKKTRVENYGTREILRSACHGYVGWWLLTEGDRKGGLAEFKKATDIFPHGLPLLRMHFEAQVAHCVSSNTITRKDVDALLDCMFSLANIYPPVLLTHIAAVLPTLVSIGEEGAARELLAGWYKLGNIIYSAQGTSRFHDVERFKLLYHYRHLLPETLRRRVRAGLSDRNIDRDLTQLEKAMVQAAKTYNKRKVRRQIEAKQWWLWIVGDHPCVDHPVSAALLWRAFKVWCRLPVGVKLMYLAKAWERARSGDIRQACIRAQLWGTTSIWSRDFA